MLEPAWRLPVALAVLTVLAAMLLPGVAPLPFFVGAAAIWLVAAGLFVVLRRRAAGRRS